MPNEQDPETRARAKTPAVFREDSNGANGNTFDAQGRLYSCESQTRRVVRMDKKGKIEVLAEKWEGKRLNAPNDIVVRKDGHIYFTDPAFGNQADTRELDFYGVYHITPKGSAEADREARGAAQRDRVFSQRADPLRRQFGRAQRARLRRGPQRRGVQRARG